MGLAALLTLAFVLVWPPVDHGSAVSVNDGVQAGTHGHHANIEENDQIRYLNVQLDADCAASAIGCCMMAHCCPGISVGPQDLPLIVCDDGATAASAVRGTGSDPGMVLPPPRRMPV
ncbi:hypothetical protein [Pararhodobacter sp. SW119]|uniref:hypothetical protein n=1 Tax=Pararhodobacter sp. SW119 TaxID=2780075 RepID=UPI001AE03B98|nr:hypothetical protein [Pararhodobacter sp. SW119]